MHEAGQSGQFSTCQGVQVGEVAVARQWEFPLPMLMITPLSVQELETELHMGKVGS
jgi:hypothetical protein